MKPQMSTLKNINYLGKRFLIRLLILFNYNFFFRCTDRISGQSGIVWSEVTEAQLGEGGGGGRGGRRGGLSCPFLKIKKSALILKKKTLIVSILRLNLPSKTFPLKLTKKNPCRGKFRSFFSKIILKLKRI